MSEPNQQDEFSIHWIQEVLERVLERDVSDYLISSGKSPSGSIHIGIMRELVVSDVIKRRLLDVGKRARTMFIVDDYDPVRAFPPGVSLSLDEWVGIPYCDVPDEFGCCSSYGAHWANELIGTFPDFGLDPEVVWTSKLYETPEMLNEVRTCLRQTDSIREIMIKYVASDFDEEQKKTYLEGMTDWYPLSVICPQCGHIQSGAKGSIVPNRVTHYDPDTDMVSFECTNCGNSDTQPLTKLRVKLTWRIDWPAKWHVFRVTCEPAGKDHSVKGGSYDTGLEVSKRVFGWTGPVKVPYEWVQIGGHDMGTSKGRVFTPKTWSSVSLPELYRFLILKTDLQRTINIQPDLLPDLVDRYDHFERVFYGQEPADAESVQLAHLLYPLSEAKKVQTKYSPKISFKFAVLMSQLTDILGQELVMQRCIDSLKKQHGIARVTKRSKDDIESRLVRALNWVNLFGSERDQVKIPETVPQEVKDTINDEDRAFLRAMVELLSGPPLEDEELQSLIFERARDVGLPEKRAFTVLYRILISRKSGPRLAPFIGALGTEWVLKRIGDVL